jgi:hypothetical protein
MTKSRKKRWEGHVECIGEKKNACRVLVEDLQEIKHLGDPRGDGRILTF